MHPTVGEQAETEITLHFKTNIKYKIKAENVDFI